MTYIDDLFAKLFPSKERKVAHKENFSLSEADYKETQAWTASEEGQKILELLYNNYHLKTAGIGKEPEVVIFNTPYANGLAISFEPPLTAQIFKHLFFAFGQRLEQLGYHRVSLDRTIEEHQKEVKHTEKLYYKPPWSTAQVNGRMDQLFGNISIENVAVDNKPRFLKVLASVYSDRMYVDARPFDQFVEQLFNR